MNNKHKPVILGPVLRQRLNGSVEFSYTLEPEEVYQVWSTSTPLEFLLSRQRFLISKLISDFTRSLEQSSFDVENEIKRIREQVSEQMERLSNRLENYRNDITLSDQFVQ